MPRKLDLVQCLSNVRSTADEPADASLTVGGFSDLAGAVNESGDGWSTLLASIGEKAQESGSGEEAAPGSSFVHSGFAKTKVRTPSTSRTTNRI